MPTIVEATGHPVGFIDTDWVNMQAVGEAIDDAPDGSVLVLENALPSGRGRERPRAGRAHGPLPGDIFVVDAFSAAHRARCRTEGLARAAIGGGTRHAGRTRGAFLEAGLGQPKKPKIAHRRRVEGFDEDRLFLQPRVTKVEALVIGGAMANTFLLAECASASRWPKRTWATPSTRSSTRRRRRAAPSSCRSGRRRCLALCRERAAPDLRADSSWTRTA